VPHLCSLFLDRQKSRALCLSMLVGICLSGQISSAQDKVAAGVVTSYGLLIGAIRGYNC
jgi:hypothetical protein